MVRLPYRRQILRSYVSYMVLRSIFLPPEDFDAFCIEYQLDLQIIHLILQTRYLRARENVPKAGNLHLAWHYAGNSANHQRFVTMLRVTPRSFRKLVRLIQGHPIFHSTSYKPQHPVDIQLAITLYRMGRYGNGASVQDIARMAGVSEGSVEKFTERCQIALLVHHDQYVRILTPEEKEVEKRWVEERTGLVGWREGVIMYDGTPVDLYQKPGLNGDAYYHRKCRYGIGLQVRHHEHFK